MSDIFLKKIAKGALMVLIGIFIAKLLSFIYRVIIARHGIEEYGLFSLALVVFSIIVSFSSFGLHKGIVYYISYFKNKEEDNKIKGIIYFSFKLLLTSSVIASILLFIFSETIAVSIFHNSDLTLVLKLMAIVIPFAVLIELAYTLMRAFHLVKYIVYSKDLFQNIAKILLTIIFLALGLQLKGIVLAYILAIGFSFLLTLYYFKKHILQIFNKALNIEYSNKILLLYSLPLMLSEGISLIYLWTDNLMLGFFTDARSLGLYNAAIPFAQLFYTFPFALMMLFFPLLSGMDFKTQRDEFKKTYITVNKWVIAINLFLLAMFIIFSKQLLSIFGPEYIEGSKVLIILSIGYFLTYTAVPPSNIMLIFRKTKWIFLNNLTLFIINIILNFVLIQKYGIIGAAIATTISLTILTLLILIESYILSRINPFKINTFKVLISILLVFSFAKLTSTLIHISSIYLVILFSLLFAFLYLILLLVTRSLEKEDFMIFKAIQDKLGIDLEFLNKFIEKFIR